MQFSIYDFITAVKFVAHAAGTRDHRHHVNGVRFVPGPDGLEVFATDGARAAFVTLAQEPEALPATSFHASLESIKALLAAIKPGKPSDARGPVTFDFGPGFEYAQVSALGVTCTLKRLDATMPDLWTRAGGVRGVMPDRGPAAEAVGISADLLAAALKAIKPYTGAGNGVMLTVGRSSDDVVKVEAGGAEVLVMPMRVKPDA